jgi:hypothetical protein
MSGTTGPEDMALHWCQIRYIILKFVQDISKIDFAHFLLTDTAYRAPESRVWDPKRFFT